MGLEIHGVTSEFTTKEEIVPFEQIKRNQQIIKIHNHNYNNNFIFVIQQNLKKQSILLSETFQIKIGQTNKYILQSKLQQPQRETIPSLQNSLTSTVAAQEDDILILIKKQWTAEYRRIQMLEKNNQFNKKSCLQHQLGEGGHAEVEDDVFLLIYGTASAMLNYSNNPFSICIFDSIIDTQLSILKDYSKLREIILKDNYINSLLQFKAFK